MLRIAYLLEVNKNLFASAIICLIVLAGAVYSIFLGDVLRFLPDEQDYLTLAENLPQEGFYTLDGQHPTAYRPPGYPLFLSPFRLMGLPIAGLRMVNFALVGLGLVFIYRILETQPAKWAGVAGVLLAAFYPLQFYTAGTLYPQVLAGTLLICATWLLVQPKSGWKITGAAGLLFGCLILTVPAFILTLGVYFAWLWRYHGRKTSLIFALAAVLVAGAWTARNFVVFNRFVIISTNSGENLLLGNSENTTPNGGRTVDISHYEAEASKMDEVTRDRYFRDQAFQYMRTHPVETARMYVLKVINFFNYRNDLVNRDQGSVLKDWIMLVTYFPMLVFFIARLLLFRRYPLSRLEVLLAGVYLTGALFSAIFFTRLRFRLPYDLLLITGVALFLSRLLQAIWHPPGKPGIPDLRKLQ